MSQIPLLNAWPGGQAQLGHATASITLDTYGHLFPSELEAWPTGWSRSERPPWRTGSGPSADQPS
jgi:integrase